MKEFELYHEKSENVSFAISNELSKDPKKWPKEWTTIDYNKYPRFPLLKFNNKPLKLNHKLIDVLHQRKSSQNNRDKISITLENLIILLQHSLGFKNNNKELNKRVYPSAGARFPLECYLIINNVDGILSGLYHFDFVNDGLNILLEKNLSKETIEIYGEKFADSQAFLILTTVINRNYIKYGERAYRFSLLEAGHVMQNICLISTALQIPMTPIGGFVDSKLIRLLDLEKEKEFPIYCCAFV